jgi:hypothetical protein
MDVGWRQSQKQANGIQGAWQRGKDGSQTRLVPVTDASEVEWD